MELFKLLCVIYTLFSFGTLFLFFGLVWWATYENEKHAERLRKHFEDSVGEDSED